MGATKRAEERIEVVRNEGAAVRRAREKLREADAIVLQVGRCVLISSICLWGQLAVAQRQ